MDRIPVSEADFLEAILDRKRREVARRIAHRVLAPEEVGVRPVDRAERAVRALRREGARLPRVIAEIKLRSPSAGALRVREQGALPTIARGYAEAGAAAVSVLCDGPGFGGCPLDLRRAAAAVSVPLLFKEFVLDPVQITLARRMGAHLVLLLARVLDDARLRALVDETERQGMAPLVEAADVVEVERALRTRARVVGVNARDLRTFRVDPEAAMRAVECIPADRVAVHMSGIATADDLARIGTTRADAVLVGEALMRAPTPGVRLRELLAAAV